MDWEKSQSGIHLSSGIRGQLIFLTQGRLVKKSGLANDRLWHNRKIQGETRENIMYKNEKKSMTYNVKKTDDREMIRTIRQRRKIRIIIKKV